MLKAELVKSADQSLELVRFENLRCSSDIRSDDCRYVEQSVQYVRFQIGEEAWCGGFGIGDLSYDSLLDGDVTMNEQESDDYGDYEYPPMMKDEFGFLSLPNEIRTETESEEKTPNCDHSSFNDSMVCTHVETFVSSSIAMLYLNGNLYWIDGITRKILSFCHIECDDRSSSSPYYRPIFNRKHKLVVRDREFDIAV